MFSFAGKLPHAEVVEWIEYNFENVRLKNVSSRFYASIQFGDSKTPKIAKGNIEPVFIALHAKVQ